MHACMHACMYLRSVFLVSQSECAYACVKVRHGFMYLSFSVCASLRIYVHLSCAWMHARSLFTHVRAQTNMHTCAHMH